VSAARIRLVARLPGSGSELSPFVVWSLVGHVVFVATLLLVPSLRPRKTFPDNPIVVNLVAAQRPAAAQVQAPAPPAEKAAPEGVRLETRKPVVTPLPKKQDTSKKKEPQKTKPAPAKPATTPPPTTDASAPQGPSGSASAADGGSISVFEGGDVQFAWYRDSVTAALYSQWRRPILSGLREPIEVRVTFEILRNGGVRDLAIEQSSGVDVFDRSALRAVSDAVPLPALPADWSEPTLLAAFVFRLFPD